MNKIAIITDTHFGARGDKVALIEFFRKFYDQIFFPTLEERGIKMVWHLGDLVDRRKFINFNTLEMMREIFLEPLKKYEAHFVLGNHDMYYKNQIEPNALEELLRGYDFHIHTRPFVTGDITVIPWICEETEQTARVFIESARTRYLFGHLEIKGHEMSKGMFSHEGDDPAQYTRFDAVLSGHYHHKSSYNNLHYLGNPYEITWVDYKDARGFHLFDLDTGELEFIENPHRLFHKIVYNDVEKTLTEMTQDIDRIKDGFVRVIIREKSNDYLYDALIDKINAIGVSDLQIVEDHHYLNMEPDEVIVEQAQSTLEILHKYVDSVHSDVNTIELKKLLKDLYDEAEVLRV